MSKHAVSSNNRSAEESSNTSHPLTLVVYEECMAFSQEPMQAKIMPSITCVQFC